MECSGSMLQRAATGDSARRMTRLGVSAGMPANDTKRGVIRLPATTVWMSAPRSAPRSSCTPPPIGSYPHPSANPSCHPPCSGSVVTPHHTAASAPPLPGARCLLVLLQTAAMCATVAAAPCPFPLPVNIKGLAPTVCCLFSSPYAHTVHHALPILTPPTTPPRHHAPPPPNHRPSPPAPPLFLFPS